MPMFCKIDRAATTVIERKRDVKPVPPEDLAGNKPYWVPEVVRTVDTSTGPDTVSEAVETIHADRVERVTTVRDKTAQEIDAEKDARIDAMDRLQFKMLFNHENRIRVLEGKPEINATQFRAALRAELNTVRK